MRQPARPAGGATHRRARPGHVGPGREERRVMANWPTPHLVAWFGTENCYLAMAASRQRDSAHWHLKKSPAECGAGVRGRGLAYLALFGRFVRARSAGIRRPLVIC